MRDILDKIKKNILPVGIVPIIILLLILPVLVNVSNKRTRTIQKAAETKEKGRKDSDEVFFEDLDYTEKGKVFDGVFEKYPFIKDRLYSEKGDPLLRNEVSNVSLLSLNRSKSVKPIEIELDGDRLRISWQKIKGAISYNVYRDTVPYFTPSSRNKIATTKNLQYVESNPGIIGSLDKNYYYTISGNVRSGKNGKPVFINEYVGEIDYRLFANELSDVALPFNNLPYSKASGLVSYLAKQGLDSGKINVLKFDARNQLFWAYLGISVGEDFSIDPLEVVLIQNLSEGDRVVTFVGSFSKRVVKQYFLEGYNYISYQPLFTRIKKVSDFENYLKDVETILVFDERRQTFVPINSLGRDLPVKVGKGYFIKIDKNKYGWLYPHKISPAFISNLKMEVKDEGIDLSWEDVPYAESYSIYRAKKKDFPLSSNYLLKTVSNQTEYLDRSAKRAIGNPSINYYYKVTAKNKVDESDSFITAGEFDFLFRKNLVSIFNLPFVIEPLTTDTLISMMKMRSGNVYVYNDIYQYWRVDYPSSLFFQKYTIDNQKAVAVYNTSSKPLVLSLSGEVYTGNKFDLSVFSSLQGGSTPPETYLWDDVEDLTASIPSIYQDLMDWFEQETGQSYSQSIGGVYAVSSIDNQLFVGVSASYPGSRDGALLLSFENGNWRSIGTLDEQGIHQLISRNGNLYIPGTDPCCNDGWDFGNIYVYFSKTGQFVKKRTLPNVIHTLGMWVEDNGSTLYAATGSHAGDNQTWQGNILESTDFGETWSILSTPSNYRVYDIAKFDGYFYIRILERNRDIKLLRSNDLVNWETVPGSAPSYPGISLSAQLSRMSVSDSGLTGFINLNPIFKIDKNNTFSAYHFPFNGAPQANTIATDGLNKFFLSSGKLAVKEDKDGNFYVVADFGDNDVHIGSIYYWKNDESLIVTTTNPAKVFKMKKNDR